MTAKTAQEKIQELELTTVQAVTELRGDVKNLTEIIRDLRKTIQDMANNYVKREDHATDITELKAEIASAKKIGNIKAILWSILTAIVTSLTITIILQAIK